MSTKRQFRKTKQVRTAAEIHSQLKFFAAARGTTISKVVDELLTLGMAAKTRQDITKHKRSLEELG